MSAVAMSFWNTWLIELDGQGKYLSYPCLPNYVSESFLESNTGNTVRDTPKFIGTHKHKLYT